MNRNGKRMKPEATCLTEGQRCEIIAKLSKLNTPNKWVLGRDYEVSEGATRKVRDNHENILQLTALMSNDAKTLNGSWTYVWWTMMIVWDISAKHQQTNIECQV